MVPAPDTWQTLHRQRRDLDVNEVWPGSQRDEWLPSSRAPSESDPAAALGSHCCVWAWRAATSSCHLGRNSWWWPQRTGQPWSQG